MQHPQLCGTLILGWKNRLGSLRCFELARIIALTAMVAAASMTAQPADATLTLACQGTTTVTTMEDAKPEPISMGIIVNFTNRTVQGFGHPGFGGLMDFPVKITAWNEVTVAFEGKNQVIEKSINGSIDRVTGDMEATSTSFNLKTNKTLSSTSYALKCRPAQRMF